MTPKINNNSLGRLTVPDFSGGVNLRDGLSGCLDNQLTEVLNLYCKNGLLTTRPAQLPLSFKADGEVSVIRDSARSVSGREYRLVSVKGENRTDLYYISAEDAHLIASVEGPKGGEGSSLVFCFGGDIYIFYSGYYEGEDTPYYIFKITESTESEAEWYDRFTVSRITDSDIYVPTVYIDCKHDDYLVPLSTATKNEGQNLLSGRCRYLFNSLNPEVCVTLPELGEGKGHYMTYIIPIDPSAAERIPSELEVTLTDIYGNKITHKATSLLARDDSSVTFREPAFAADGKLIEVKVSGSVATVTFRFFDGGAEKTAYLSVDSPRLKHDLEITAPRETGREELEKVLGMTAAERYGGSEGIWGGMHLFLGRNSLPENKSLICWSDFERPLYFSEDNTAFIGDRSRPHTAFAKQGESLILFKEGEIYSADYSSGEISIRQIHSSIGCDCENTVALCRNRLIFADSGGKVYTLSSGGSYTERSVLPLSAMVEPALSALGREAMKGAVSADWQGLYVLSVGGRVFLMEYGSYGYANISSYTRSDDAQAHIPWWIWEFPSRPEKLFELQGELYFISGGRLFTLSGDTDRLEGGEEGSIETALCTKLFDFGSPTTLKKVGRIDLSLGANEGEPIEIRAVGDRGSDDGVIVIAASSRGVGSPEHFTFKTARSSAKLNRRIGYRLTSRGKIELDSMSVWFRRM